MQLEMFNSGESDKSADVIDTRNKLVSHSVTKHKVSQRVTKVDKPVPKLQSLLNKAKREGWHQWIKSEHDERAVLAGCYFDADIADWTVDFIEGYCVHSKGRWAGQHVVLMDWQKNELIRPLFGWINESGYRRFRRCYVEIPKKNGKSTLASTIGLYMLCADGESGAEIYAAASKRDQAKIVFSEACHMVARSPMLSADLKVIESTNRIIYRAEASKWCVLSKDARGAEGINPHCIIADELHVWHGRDFWDSLQWGDVVRTQPLIFAITTAGILDKTTIGWTEHAYAMEYLKGQVHNQEYMAVVYGASEGVDPLDPEVHAATNPSYGTIIQPDEMLKSAEKAVSKKSELGPYLRYRLNVWTESSDSFFNMFAYRECNYGAINEDMLKGRPCYGGLDLASKKDVAAWVLLFPPLDDEDDRWVVLPRFFVPKNTAQKRESDDGVLYYTWGTEDYMQLTHGDTIDFHAIKDQIKADCKSFDIQDVGADPWNMEYMRQELLNDIPELDIVEFPQGFRYMTEPVKRLESLIIDKQLSHGGHPVLEWMVGNAAVKEDNNENIRLDKKNSRDKIDGVIALTMAVGRAMAAEQDQGSIYDTQGIMVV